MKFWDWKHIANVAKVLVAVEMGVMFWLLPDRNALEIVTICLGQYAVFSPIDASQIIKAIKSPVADK